MQDFSLYPIQGLARECGREQFDLSRLPIEIVPGVRIEDVSTYIASDTFKLVERDLGARAVKTLSETHYALVHRHDAKTTFQNGEMVQEHAYIEQSEQLVRKVAACLRVIRPMRQYSNFMRGIVRDDGKFDVRHFQSPADLIAVPEIQALFLLRDKDADDLVTFAPEFLRAMDGNFWKFRMAVQFHELGYWAQEDKWKARYLLWASAIESIYTSHTNQGSRLAKRRIKWFLGESTSIYPLEDLADTMLPDPRISIGLIADDLYKLRNFIAHGDRIPDAYFNKICRSGLNGGVTLYEGLFEAQSFIIRSSLLKILQAGLLSHFEGAATADAYFKSHGLAP
jgi:hypothetical protein